ncbi:glycosyltransferase family 4 protein [Candidatus Woesearchaeota archaeon]|nr:glycosyltransferase family 4 protein [Candidatus Woesearchaeota archaeon]
MNRSKLERKKEGILFVTLSDKNTIDNSIHQYILKELQERFNTVTVFCRGEKSTHSEKNITYYSGNFMNWFKNLKDIKNIKIVYINDFFVGGIFGILAKKMKKASLVFRCGSPWKYEGKSLSVILKTAIVMFTKPIVIKSCKRVAYNSHSIIQKKYKHQWNVVYNGVDINLFKPKKIEEDQKSRKLNLLFIGRIIKEKGLPYLLEGMSKLSDIATLDLIGDGPLIEHYRQKYPSVNFLGRARNSDLPEMIAERDVVILPSLTKSSESFPNVLLEAMACGKPVIGTRVWGIPEIIDDTVNGFLVKERDVASIIEAVHKIKDPLQQEQMGQRAREKVVQHFELSKQINDLCDYLIDED